MSTTAKIVGAIALLSIGGAIALPLTSTRCGPSQKGALLSSIKQSSVALFLYAQSNDEKLPLGATWESGVAPFVRPGWTPTFTDQNGVVFSTAFNSFLSSASLAAIEHPNQVPLLFSKRGYSPSPQGDASDISLNIDVTSGEMSNMFGLVKERAGAVICADGAARIVSNLKSNTFQWKPKP